MNASTLEVALRALGMSCTVEAHGRVAVLISKSAHTFPGDPSLRREAVRLAREHGFTNLALELDDARDGMQSESGSHARSGRQNHEGREEA